MKIYIASDHRGYELKKYLLKELKSDYEIIDLGCNSKESVDYPDYAFKLGKEVVNNKTFGIAICGSGIGISIACNKVKGIRCAKVNSLKDVRMTRNDNDSNIIALYSEINQERALRLVKEFITFKASNDERHVRRRNKIKEYESKN